jgi:hypothetical protein
MGHLKLTPPDKVLSPKFAGRLKAEVEAVGPPGAEDVALAKIAQRFAPGVQSVVAADDRRFDHKALRISVLALLPGLRTLVLVLIVVALLPSLTLAGMFWLRVIDTPWSALDTLGHNESAPQLVQTASLIGMPARNQLKQNAEIPPVSLTAPIILEAKAGEEMPFAIGVISTDALPARSIIAISRLPHGSAFSSGRPYGEREWNLRSDEIGDLRIVLPNTASGETKLRIDLIAPDGESIANAETLLKVTAEANSSALVVGPRDHEHAPELEVSDFSGFRAYFASAAQDGSKDATLVFGATYDPIFALRSGAYGINSEPLEGEDWSDQDQEVDSSSAAAKPKDDPVAPKASDESVQSPISPPAPAQVDATHSWIELSEFVNLREGPSSSARVIGVMAKGSKLHPIARKRGWVKVTNVATSEAGWIYSGYAASVTKSRRSSQNAVPARLGPGSDDSFWTKLGQWVMGP